MTQDEAVSLNPIQKYKQDKVKIIETIIFLEYLGGKDLSFNPYKDTIIRLQGMESGANLLERAVDL